jgi:predicted Fe-Mo cluster-binding NifX family protein
MNICITAHGPDLTSRFEPHFARAPYFVFYDSRSGRVHAIRNGFTIDETRIGQNVVKLLSSYHVDTVITGKTGSNAHNLLQAANITITIWPNEGTVRQALISVFPDIKNLNEAPTESKTLLKADEIE